MPDKFSFLSRVIPDAKVDTTSKQQESADKSRKNLDEVRRDNKRFGSGSRTEDKPSHRTSDRSDYTQLSHYPGAQVTSDLTSDEESHNEIIMQKAIVVRNRAQRVYRGEDSGKYKQDLSVERQRDGEGNYLGPGVKLSHRTTKDNPVVLGGVAELNPDNLEPLKHWNSDKIAIWRSFCRKLHEEYPNQSYNLVKALEKVAHLKNGYKLYMEWHETNETRIKDYRGVTEKEYRDLTEAQKRKDVGDSSGSLH